MSKTPAFRIMLALAAFIVATALLPGCPPAPTGASPNIAREWNELMLQAMRKDKARPPIYARTAFHVSAAMYEAWAAYDETATGYFTGYRLKQPAAARTRALTRTTQ